MEKAMPKYIFDKITDITPEDLHKIGAAAIGIDLDNTTVYDSAYRPREGVPEWLDTMKKHGIPVIIITNTYPLRAKLISKKFGVPFLALSNKPDPKNLLLAAERIGIPIESLAMIGDQLFTDVEAANACGAIPIWVRPFMREKVFAKKFARRRQREKEFCERHGIEYKQFFK